MSINKKTKVLLLDPPLGRDERSGALSAATGRSIPYGLLSIAAVLHDAGYVIEFIDAANFGLGVDETIQRIIDVNPDYLGITTVTMSVERSARLAAKLKEQLDIPVIVGGPHISSIPKETMDRFEAFDVGVVGEGEHTMVDLMDALVKGRDLAEVEGIIFRRDGTVVQNKRRPLIEDLDSLPMPKWDLLPDLINTYRPSAPSYLRVPATTIITSRGCSGHCIFCNSRSIHGKIRYFSADYVLRMIEHLVEHYDLRDLSIYDDNFIRDTERVEKICNTILEKGIDLTWSCYSRVDQGNYDLFTLMKKAGCWQISYGVESGNQAILDFLKKGVTLEQIEKTVTDTHRAGLRTRGFFIIGHMTETVETIKETIAFLLRLPLDDFHFTSFTPLPGTRAYRMADEYGEFDKTWNRMNLQYPCFIPKGLSSEVMDAYSKEAYRRFYFRPRIVLSYLKLLVENPQNVRRLINGFTALVSRIVTREHFAVSEDTTASARAQAVDYERDTPSWEWAHKHAPAARHRRRLIKKALEGRVVSSCLDAGCAQPFLLEELAADRPGLEVAGCDVSWATIEKNRKIFPSGDFFVMDLASKPQDVAKRYDLVICSEVLEHIPDWEKAVATVTSLSNRLVVVTVPGGTIHPVDEIVGHVRHFQGPELEACFERNGFRTVEIRKWGFPVHSAYRYAVNKTAPEKIYESFTRGGDSAAKRALGSVLNAMFYANDLFDGGSQIIALFEKVEK